MAGKALFKYYIGHAGIFIVVLAMIIMLIPDDQYGNEILAVLIVAFSYVWIIFAKMRSEEDYMFINSLPISKAGQWDVFSLTALVLIISSYMIIYLLTFILNGNNNMTLEDVLISLVTKILFCAFLTSLCMLYLAHGIPGVKRISAALLVLGVVFWGSGRIINLTIVSLGYKGNNPLNLIKEKWNLLTVPMDVLQSGEVTFTYYSPDYSISARWQGFAAFCVAAIFLTAAAYYRARKIYGRIGLEKPAVSVLEKMHPVFVLLVSCAVSAIIAIYAVMGENSCYVENTQVEMGNIVLNDSYYLVRDERVCGTIYQGYNEYFSYQIYDMERNDKVFMLWCGCVAAGILAGSAAGIVIICKGRGKRHEDICKVQA